MYRLVLTLTLAATGPVGAQASAGPWTPPDDCPPILWPGSAFLWEGEAPAEPIAPRLGGSLALPY